MNSLTADANYDIIKKTVAHYFPDGKVILFGSRARGEQTNDSDYDLLIITENISDKSQRIKNRGKLNQTLAANGIDADLIIQSKQELGNNINLIGHIVRYAVSEGVYL